MSVLCTLRCLKRPEEPGSNVSKTSPILRARLSQPANLSCREGRTGRTTSPRSYPPRPAAPVGGPPGSVCAALPTPLPPPIYTTHTCPVLALPPLQSFKEAPHGPFYQQAGGGAGMLAANSWCSRFCSWWLLRCAMIESPGMCHDVWG